MRNFAVQRIKHLASGLQEGFWAGWSHRPLSCSFADPGCPSDLSPRTPLTPQRSDPQNIYGHPGTAYPLALGLRCRHPRAYSVADQFPLELRNAGEDAEDKPTIGRAGINAFMYRNEVDPQRPELLQSVDELPQAPSKAVVSVHDDSIHEPLAAGNHQVVQRMSPFA